MSNSGAANFYAREFARLIKELREIEAEFNEAIAEKEKEIDKLLEEYHAA